MKPTFYLSIALILLVSCSPQSKLRRAKKLIAQAEASGLEWKSDTVFREVRIEIPASSADTIVKVVNWTDTLTLVRDRITTKVLVRPETKTVYISSKCDPVTLIKKVPYTVSREIVVEQSFWKKLGRSALAGILGIILGFALCWFGKLFRVIP
jgi:hypothetical protein